MFRLTLIFAVVVGILLTAIPSMLWLICWIAGKFFHLSIGYAPFGWSAVGLVTLAWLTLLYGFLVGRFQLEIQRSDFTHEEITAAMDGYKIVHISDLHLSTFDDRPHALQRFVDSVNAQKPDLICFTGDLVTIGVKEAEPYTEILRQLKATDGVISVLGNHDFLIYRRNFASDDERHQEVEHLAQYEREVLGWHLLRNEHLVLPNHLTIVGVDNSSGSEDGFHTICAADLPKALSGTSAPRIVLTHDPTHWRHEIIGHDVFLTLSGHTHSGQVRFFGRPLSGISFKESAGWVHEGKQFLYINSGLGCTLPIRLNCPAEITVITLHSQH